MSNDPPDPDEDATEAGTAGTADAADTPFDAWLVSRRGLSIGGPAVLGGLRPLPFLGGGDGASPSTADD